MLRREREKPVTNYSGKYLGLSNYSSLVAHAGIFFHNVWCCVVRSFETSLHCGVRSALHDLQQARDRVNHIRRVVRLLSICVWYRVQW